MNSSRAQQAHDMMHNVAAIFDISGQCLVIGEGYVAPFQIRYENVGGQRLTLPSDSEIYEYDSRQVPMGKVLDFWFRQKGFENGSIVCLTEGVRREVEGSGLRWYQNEDGHYSLVTASGCNFDVFTPYKSRRTKLMGHDALIYEE